MTKIFYYYKLSIASLQPSTGKLTLMKFEDGPYYIGGKNRVDKMRACMGNEVVLNGMNFNVMNFNVMVSAIT